MAARRKFDATGFLGRLRAGAKRAEYLSNHVLFAQGDPSDTLFYVEKGVVQLSTVSPQGREAIISTLNSGSFFGEACLTGQTARSLTARTLTAGTFARIPRRTMVRALEKSPALSSYFMSHLLDRNLQIEEELMNHLFNSSEKRLARLLLSLADFARDGQKVRVLKKIDQQTLARMVGTTRGRVSHFMNGFRRLGLIEYNGGLRVHSSLINVVLSK